MAEVVYCKDCRYYHTTEVKSIKHFCKGPPGLPAKFTEPFDTCKHAVKKKEKEKQ